MRVDSRTGKNCRSTRNTYSDGEGERSERRSKRLERTRPTELHRDSDSIGDDLGTHSDGAASAIGNEVSRSDPWISNAKSENTFSNVYLLPKVLNTY